MQPNDQQPTDGQQPQPFQQPQPQPAQPAYDQAPQPLAESVQPPFDAPHPIEQPQPSFPQAQPATPQPQVAPTPQPFQPQTSQQSFQQPQPQPFPQATPQPIQQPSPAFPMAPPVGAPYNPGGGGNTKKLLVIGGIVVGVLLLLGIVGAVLLSLFSVSKADYEASANEMETLRSAYSDLQSLSYVSSSATEVERTNSLDSLEKSKAELDAAIEGLSDDKAIKYDSEAKKKYEALLEKKKSFDKALNAIKEAYSDVIPGVTAYAAAYDSQDPATVLAGLKSARTTLEGATVEDENNRTLIDAMISIIKQQEELLPKIIAARSDYRQYDSSVNNAYYDTANQLNDAIGDWQSNLEKMSDDSEINDELNDLGEYLTKKIYE